MQNLSNRLNRSIRNMIKNLGDRIRKQRELAGETQKELAEGIGVAQSAVSQWEKGINEPKATYLKAISLRYNVTSDYLLGITDIF